MSDMYTDLLGCVRTAKLCSPGQTVVVGMSMTRL